MLSAYHSNHETAGKRFDELSGKQRQSVAGHIGGEHRKQHMAEAEGGDTHQVIAKAIQNFISESIQMERQQLHMQRNLAIYFELMNAC